MGFPNVRLVTFDVTNTLLKFRVAPWQQYGAAARAFGYRGNDEDLAHRFRMSYREMWMQYPNFGRSSLGWREWWRRVVSATFAGKLPVSADMDTLASRLVDQYRNASSWCLVPGARRLLSILQTRGLKLGVISNFDPRLLDILHNLNLADDFNFVITSYNSGFYKPDRKIFEYALKKCPEVMAKEAMHIGDDVKKDYEAAKAAGWHAVLVNDRPSQVRYAFSNINELINAIEEKDFL